jgi:hypothetical protein
MLTYADVCYADCAFGFNYKAPLRMPWEIILKQV